MGYSAKFTKNGNIKIGKTMWSFNKLAGNGILNNCKGSCGKYCKGCYDETNPRKSKCYVFKSYITYGWEKSSVVKGHKRNTEAIRNDINQAFEDLKVQIQKARIKPSAIRIHASGELESSSELLHWIDIAQQYSEIPFYIYTKAYDIIDNVLYNEETLPNNLFVNISIWHDIGLDCYNRWKDIPTIRAFVFDDGFDYGDKLNIPLYCPAYKKNDKGKTQLKHDITCDMCKLCFKETNKVIGCLDH